MFFCRGEVGGGVVAKVWGSLRPPVLVFVYNGLRESCVMRVMGAATQAVTRLPGRCLVSTLDLSWHQASLIPAHTHHPAPFAGPG